VALREKRKLLRTREPGLRAAESNLGATESAGREAQTQLERSRAHLERLEREIASLAYDADAHLRSVKLEQFAAERRNLASRLAAQQQARIAEEGRLRLVDKGVHDAAESLESASRRAKDSERLRASAKEAFEALRSRHGSADAVQRICEEMQLAPSQALDIDRLRGAIALLETQAAASRAKYEGACKHAAEGEAALESARLDLERQLARDRVAGLRQSLTPGEPCPVCEHPVGSPPPPLSTEDVSRARARRDAAEMEQRMRRDGV
jgi:exonuclease SbcC